MPKKQVETSSQDMHGSIQFPSDEPKSPQASINTKDSNDEVIHSTASQQMDALADKSARVILDIKSVFPFKFFPDEMIVDETKVSVHLNYFFYSKEVRSIEYRDIFNVIVQQGLFFANLEIVDRFFSDQPVVIRYLSKRNATRARHLIQGLIIAKKQNINTQTLSMKELVDNLDRIGKSR